MTDLNDPILRVFLQEGAEQIESLNDLLLRLETNPHDAEVIAQIMRTAHNLKGTSGTAGLRKISEAAHKVEECIARIRSAELDPAPQVFDCLFKTVDTLDSALDQISAGGEEPQSVGEAIAQINDMLERSGDQNDTAQTSPATKAGYVLGEYDHVRIRVLKQRGKNLFDVELVLPAKLANPLDWALKTIRSLRQSGDVVATLPPEVDLSTVEKSRHLLILVGTALSANEVQELLAKEKPEKITVTEYGAAAPVPAPAEKSHAKERGSVKVDLARVDGIVDMIGELVIVQSMVANAPEIQSLSSRNVQNYLGQLTRITRDLQDAGLKLRMVPLRGVFQVLARTVRDLARKHDKAINFSVVGEDIEMDRSVVEKITDPLVHIVRNAVDHGIETSEQRAHSKKPKTATIGLAAYHQGGNIVVEVTDDGRGLNKEAILEKAKSMGLVREGAVLSENEIFNFVFESGFSTAAKVTDTSGRGVGLDIVRRNVESMRGRVVVSSLPQKGTTIRMVLPLTLAIIDGMLISCGPERYIVPTIAIVESIRPHPSAILTVSGRWQMMNLRDHMLPLIPLGSLFGAADCCTDPAKGIVVVVEGIGRRVGLVVDDVLSQQQVVIKNIGGGLGDARYLSGAAILPDGQVGLILNIDEIAAVGSGFKQETEAALAAENNVVGPENSSRVSA